MRRLRAILSASRLARGAGVVASARRVTSPGGVGRRAVLVLIGAAPLAAPAMARSAMAPEASSTLLSEWATYGQACAQWFDANPSTVDVMTTAGLDVQHDGIVGTFADRKADQVARVAHATSVHDFSGVSYSDLVGSRDPNAAAYASFIDDVGGGP